MASCRKCKSTSIQSRRSFPFGRKSRSRTKKVCRECGSTDVEMRSNNRRGGRRR